MNMKRYALVRGHGVTLERVAAYLPSNYKATWAGTTDWHLTRGGQWVQNTGMDDAVVLIEGRDTPSGGFGLDGYVIPRLGSGGMRCDEVDLAHAVLKEVPA